MVEVACWAHSRRKLFDVHANTGSAIAKEALERIAALFQIEAESTAAPRISATPSDGSTHGRGSPT